MDRFLSLCDPHKGIIHQFGCEGSCTHTAAICLKGCSHFIHQQKVGKHQFVSARELYSVVGSIRERYSQFKTNFKQVYVRSFVDNLKETLKSFELYLATQFLQKNPLVDLFCRYTSSGGQMVQQVIEDKLDQVQFSQLKCREIFQLRQFEELLQREGREEQQTRVIRLLSRVFEYHLRDQKILLPQKMAINTDRKIKLQEQEMIEVDRLDSLIETLQKRITNMEYSQRQQKVQQLLLIIRCEPKELQKNIENMAFINKLYTNLQNFLERALPQRLTLAVNFGLGRNNFWDSFSGFLGNKGLKQVKILTTSQRNPGSKTYQHELKKRYDSIFPVEVKYQASWQQIAALIKMADG